MQLDPVPPPSIFTAVIHTMVFNLAASRQEGTLYKRATDLFLLFEIHDLLGNERSHDSEHTQFVQTLHDLRAGETPITPDMIARLPRLSAADAHNPAFATATTVVLNNHKRAALTLAQATRYGQQHGQPVITWDEPLTRKYDDAYTPAELE